MLGLTEPFFHRLVAPLVEEMGEAYPELAEARQRVERVLRQEEERFAETLEKGLKILEQDIARLDGEVIPGSTIFELYDTYGFPVDLTNDIARERGLKLDMDGFEREMDKQRERARAASQFQADYGSGLAGVTPTRFTGYERLSDQGRVVAIVVEGSEVDTLQAGSAGAIVLDHTPFYAESGGQVGDSGVLCSEGTRFVVEDTQKSGETFLHIGRLESGSIQRGASLTAEVDAARRQAIVLNHSATHLMHAALREVLGDHVQQKGSLVTRERLRFDFSHFEPMTPAQIAEVERIVNAQIRQNQDTESRVLPFQEALDAGALAFFDDKYGDEVRVMSIGFSTELCGGTHVGRVGDIGLFKVVGETGIASGVRRIEAVTGENALRWIDENSGRLDRVAELVRAGRAEVDDKVRQLVDRAKTLEKQVEQLQAQLASRAGSELAEQAVEIDGIKVLAAKLDGADPKSLRETVDQLKNKLGAAAVVLATVRDGKVSLVAGVTKDQVARIKAGDLVNSVAVQVGGRGGGRPDMAQAGGTDPAKLDAALQGVPDWVRTQLH
jgi:alanyl-tRNA synthetase